MLELDAWLEFRELNKGQSASTISNYRLEILRYGVWLQARTAKPEHATPEQLQEYAGAYLHGRGLSASSRRVAVSALRGYYAWLLKRKHLRHNPAADLPYPTTGRKLPVPIPLADAEKVMAQPDLDTFKGIRDLAILAVLIGCGPRVSGVVGLNESDLIFTKSPEGFEELTLRLREKGKHERLVPAPEETRLAIRAYHGHQELELRDRYLPSGEQLLFVNLRNSKVPAHERRGENLRLSTWSVHKMLKGYGEEAGVDPKLLHPHAFRHLFGAELAEGDVDLIVRKQLMGHASEKSTELYSHIAFRKLRKAAIESNPMRRIKSPLTGLAAALRGGG